MIKIAILKLLQILHRCSVNSLNPTQSVKSKLWEKSEWLLKLGSKNYLNVILPHIRPYWKPWHLLATALIYWCVPVDLKSNELLWPWPSSPRCLKSGAKCILSTHLVLNACNGFSYKPVHRYTLYSTKNDESKSIFGVCWIILHENVQK